tara:strand:- start:67 stop:282 length:216 start_codon:yes stop_codon:yes gene_type:complete
MNETIEIRGELYVIKRKVKIDNDPIVDEWKDYLNVDTVFKHQPSGYFLFCNHIPSISYEESQDESIDASSN